MQNTIGRKQGQEVILVAIIVETDVSKVAFLSYFICHNCAIVRDR
jgi:hypothetical protein